MTGEVRGDGGGASDDGLAPVIPLFGSTEPVRERRRAAAGSAEWHTTWSDDVESTGQPESGGGRFRSDGSGPETPVGDGDDQRIPAAEKLLLRRLRGRSLSVIEARAVLAQLDLEPHEIDQVLADFQRRGYLDDDALAEQLVHIGVDRKGQGRQVISMTLSSRGVPRDVAERALEAMPDDDAERALEFALSKIRSMRDLDHDTALRRLTGQLARRGYGGQVAFTAARAALDSLRSTGGVRFD